MMKLQLLALFSKVLTRLNRFSLLLQHENIDLSVIHPTLDANIHATTQFHELDVEAEQFVQKKLSEFASAYLIQRRMNSRRELKKSVWTV